MFLKTKEHTVKTLVLIFFSNLIKKLEKLFTVCYPPIKCNNYKKIRVSNRNKKYRLTK